MTAWINGRRGTAIDWRDRGLHYGDGLFETLRIRDGRIRALDLHLDRILGGCRKLSMPAPSRARLARELERAVLYREGVIKLILTRGPGPRGYRPTGRERGTRIVSVHGLPLAAEQTGRPVSVRVCSTRMGLNPAVAGLKTLNRLESVLARAEWRDARVWEGLLLDTEENVISGTMSNLFLRRGSVITTPLVDRCGVAGVMRRRVLEAAASLGFEARQARVRWRELCRCEEAFLTNAVVGVKSIGLMRRGAERVRLEAFDAAAAFRAHLDA